MDASALVSALDNLEKSWESLDSWLNFWTFLVVAGVAVELAVLIVEYIHDRREFRRSVIHAPEKPSLVVYGLGFIGAALVAIGVAGEFRVHFTAGRIESEMREDTRKLVSIADGDASHAREETARLNMQAEGLKKQAEDERTARVELEDKVAWRTFSSEQQADIRARLSRFSGQFAQFDFLSSYMEAFSFSSDIASALRTARWRVVPPSPNIIAMKEIDIRGRNTASPVEAIDIGVEVVSTANALDAAHAVVDELQSLGFDAHFRPSTERAQPLPTVWVMVEHRPLGAQGAAKLREQKNNTKQP